MSTVLRYIYISMALILLLSCASEAVQTAKASDALKIRDTSDLDRYLEAYSKDSSNVELTRAIMDFYATMDKYEELIAFAKPIFEKYKDSDTHVASMVSAYIAYPYILTNEADSARLYLDYSRKFVDRYPDLTIMYNNTESQYSIKFDMNHTQAMRNLNHALEYADKNNLVDDKVVLLGNIASMYFLRFDTTGLSYAREAYQLAKQVEDPYIRSFSAYTLGVLESIFSFSDKAIEHIEESISYIKECNYLNSLLSKSYTSLASTYIFTGNLDRAEEAYRNAFKYLDCISDQNVHVQLYCSYASFNLLKKNYREARHYFMLAKEISEGNKSIDNKFNIYYGLSELYSRMGKYDSAYVYHKLYTQDYNNTFSLQKEKELNKLFAEYDKVQYENQLQKQEIRLINSRKTIYLILFILLLTAGALLSVFIIYRKKDAMYLQLVAQHQQLLQQKEASDRLKVQERHDENPADAAERDLFNRLEETMSRDRIYRDSEISLAKLAEILNSNRTYISTIINKYANKSFYNYIHSYRINEAISIISDPEKDVVLKAVSNEVGYKSLSCFYRAFQKETGCTPVIYREKVLQLRNMDTPKDLPIDL